jgi:hypothetical protein
MLLFGLFVKWKFFPAFFRSLTFLLRLLDLHFSSTPACAPQEVNAGQAGLHVHG